MKQTQFQGVFEIRKKSGSILLTKNLVPGRTVYFEKLFREGNDEFRDWDPRRSKLSAGIFKDIKEIGIKPGDFVLYLGASTGTTVSHVSDIVGEKGFVFALDFAPRVVRNLVYVCEVRKNIAPLLADANKPESFAQFVCPVDVVYMDIAQKNQTEIFLKNVDLFLKKGGFALLALKARSVDVTKDPAFIFKQVRIELSQKLDIIDERYLGPFEKDHSLFVCRKR
jgi:fibrillarin-like pre-rRNA processing protein